jgi:hypothetical protein
MRAGHSHGACHFVDEPLGQGKWRQAMRGWLLVSAGTSTESRAQRSQIHGLLDPAAIILGPRLPRVTVRYGPQKFLHLWSADRLGHRRLQVAAKCMGISEEATHSAHRRRSRVARPSAFKRARGGGLPPSPRRAGEPAAERFHVLPPFSACPRLVEAYVKTDRQTGSQC